MLKRIDALAANILCNFSRDKYLHSFGFFMEFGVTAIKMYPFLEILLLNPSDVANWDCINIGFPLNIELTTSKNWTLLSEKLGDPPTTIYCFII